MITQKLLQDRFDYKNGHLIYKINTKRGQQKIGDIAGSTNNKGYIQISIDSKIYKAHRLIYIYHKGDIPDGMQIDHINGIKNDNRLENLRIATPLQNRYNVPKLKTNTSGFKGVTKHRKKWKAQININGKNKHLCLCDTRELASEAYKQAADKLHGEFAYWE